MHARSAPQPARVLRAAVPCLDPDGGQWPPHAATLTDTTREAGGCAAMKRRMSAGEQLMRLRRSSSERVRHSVPSMAWGGGGNGVRRWDVGQRELVQATVCPLCRITVPDAKHGRRKCTCRMGKSFALWLAVARRQHATPLLLPKRSATHRLPQAPPHLVGELLHLLLDAHELGQQVQAVVVRDGAVNLQGGRAGDRLVRKTSTSRSHRCKRRQSLGQASSVQL